MATWVDSMIRLFYFSMIAWIFGAMLPSCDTASAKAEEESELFLSKRERAFRERPSSDTGGVTPTIHLPFASGHVTQCTQGANGDTSHHLISTKNDVDFDTSNTQKEQVRAPVSGIAYVHTEDAEANFGYHISIDRGDGTYVIIAHLSEIKIKNGQKVVAGEFLGYEGCTGFCKGDHVHIGLHKGDARKMGHFGTSIPVRYMLSDKTVKSSVKAIDSTSLVCGVKALGDPVNGHLYVSALPGVHESTVNTTQNPGSSSHNNNTNPDDVWIENMEIDTVKHVLNMSTARWLNANLASQDAYVWGTGGCFDQKLTEADRVQSQNGYYQIDFAKRSQNCGGDFTLISVVGTDGKPPNTSMTNWNWWQNAAMCSQGSYFCELQKNGQAWEEWMMRVAWNPYSGLAPSGNGYTKNTQLK